MKPSRMTNRCASKVLCRSSNDPLRSPKQRPRSRWWSWPCNRYVCVTELTDGWCRWFSSHRRCLPRWPRISTSRFNWSTNVSPCGNVRNPLNWRRPSRTRWAKSVRIDSMNIERCRSPSFSSSFISRPNISSPIGNQFSNLAVNPLQAEVNRFVPRTRSWSSAKPLNQRPRLNRTSTGNS